MTLGSFINGVAVLKPYYTEPDGYHLGAEHDQIFVYATDKALPPKKVQQMVDLGWWQEEGGADEDSPEKYDRELGWTCFV